MKHSVSSTTDARDLIMAQLSDQIFGKGHSYVATAMNIGFIPDGNPAMPLVAFSGRGQVGKTSLLRSIFRSPSHVSRSNRQQRRDAINYLNVGDVFNVADLPGYGGTSVPWSCVLQHAALLRNYVRAQPSLKMLYYCMDVHYKHGIYVQDIDMLQFLSKEVPNFTIVITKAEQLGQGGGGKLLRMQDIRQELLYNDIHHPVMVTSAYRMGGIDTLRFDMVMNCLHSLPTERLTFTEAKRLSERLLSQKELSTVRAFPVPPTQLDDQLRAWNAEVAEEIPSAPLLLEEAQDQGSLGTSRSLLHSVPEESSGEDFGMDVTAVAESVKKDLLAKANEKEHLVAFPHDPLLQAAYERVLQKTQNKGLMTFVQDTSPFRNPLNWPTHVVPTKHPKSNVMRCPGNLENPYLFQPTFVAPRADMYFRRPNVGTRKASKKGRYEADQPLAYLVKPYTIPFFPDIVDTNMHPQPWTFLGSREAYHERGGGRQLGLRLSEHARDGETNPLLDVPAPSNQELTKELKLLEERRYGKPIAMLKPPPKPISSVS